MTKVHTCVACGKVVPHHPKSGQANLYCSHECRASARMARGAPTVLAGTPFEIRFWAQVNKAGPTREGVDGPCWLWTGATKGQGHGYGVVARNGRSTRAHRASWEMHAGRSADGLCVLHKCDNPPCVNPAHLFLGTHKKNAEDKMAKGRAVLPRWESRARNPNARLSDGDVASIRAARAAGEGPTSLSRRFGIHKSHVHRIVRGTTWKDSDDAHRGSAQRDDGAIAGAQLDVPAGTH
jgi:hypothetical protein